MSEERIQKIKWTTLIGAGLAMGGILLLQLIARMLLSGGNSGVTFGELEVISLLKSMTIFGMVGAVSGFMGGMFSPIEEKKRPTHVKHEDDDEDDDNEAAQETLAKLGIAKERDLKRRAE